MYSSRICWYQHAGKKLPASVGLKKLVQADTDITKVRMWFGYICSVQKKNITDQNCGKRELQTIVQANRTSEIKCPEMRMQNKPFQEPQNGKWRNKLKYTWPFLDFSRWKLLKWYHHPHDFSHLAVNSLSVILNADHLNHTKQYTHHSKTNVTATMSTISN
jgi:hypothetical protein